MPSQPSLLSPTMQTNTPDAPDLVAIAEAVGAQSSQKTVTILTFINGAVLGLDQLQSMAVVDAVNRILAAAGTRTTR